MTGRPETVDTVRFAPGRPLSDELVRRLVEARIAENAARGAPRGLTGTRRRGNVRS
jgi:uncharacterized protein YdhG (YjbR/CyaY superfamily)